MEGVEACVEYYVYVVCVVCVLCVCVFFFQAEEGIRDLVRSRGLGDVYKRQREGERYGLAALVPEGVDLCISQRMMVFRITLVSGKS